MTIPAKIITLVQKNGQEESRLMDELLENRREGARLDLAAIVMEENLKTGLTIKLLEWSEDPESDGTFDLTLGEIFQGEEPAGKLKNDYGGFPYGMSLNEDGDIQTLWDEFLNEDGDIDTSKVWDYINTL